MQPHGWPMDIQRLTALDHEPCTLGGCNREAEWEIIYEDLKEPSPASEIVAVRDFRTYCDEHARQICLEGEIELPGGLLSLE